MPSFLVTYSHTQRQRMLNKIKHNDETSSVNVSVNWVKNFENVSYIVKAKFPLIFI